MTDKYSELKQKALTTLNLMVGAINNGGKNFMDIHEEFAERVVYDSKEFVAELEQEIREETLEEFVKEVNSRFLIRDRIIVSPKSKQRGLLLTKILDLYLKQER